MSMDRDDEASRELGEEGREPTELESALANDTLRDVVKQTPLLVGAETSVAEAIRRMQSRETQMTDAFTEKDTVVARNEKVVRRFIDAWAALDVEAAVACLAPNIVYINQPLEPVVGLVNVRKIIQGILDRTKKVEWKLLNVFGRGNTICTERLDCWDFDGKGWSLKLPCIGMFDLDADGKICGWRDYFDNQLWFKNGGPRLHI